MGRKLSPGLAHLLTAGRLSVGDELYHPRRHRSTDEQFVARVTKGGIEVHGKLYKSPSQAAADTLGYPVNGWKFWRLRSTGKLLNELRK